MKKSLTIGNFKIHKVKENEFSVMRQIDVGVYHVIANCHHEKDAKMVASALALSERMDLQAEERKEFDDAVTEHCILKTLALTGDKVIRKAASHE